MLLAYKLEKSGGNAFVRISSFFREQMYLISSNVKLEYPKLIMCLVGGHSLHFHDILTLRFGPAQFFQFSF